MKRTMVYLPDEIHEGLRELAFDKRVSMAELIRRAVEFAYGEVLEDIRDMEIEMADYLADPSTSISIDELIAEHQARVRTRDKAAS